MKESPAASSEIETNLSVHVFSVSAAMVGVCLTVIELIKMNGTQSVHTVADEALACDSLLFLGACFVSFLALRIQVKSRLRRVFGKISEVSFLVALFTMVMVSATVVFELL